MTVTEEYAMLSCVSKIPGNVFYHIPMSEKGVLRGLTEIRYGKRYVRSNATRLALKNPNDRMINVALTGKMFIAVAKAVQLGFGSFY